MLSLSRKILGYASRLQTPTMRLTGLSGLAAPQSLLPEMGTILARVFSAKTELYSLSNIYQEIGRE